MTVQLTPQLLDAARDLGRRMQCNGDLHSEDLLLEYFLTHSKRPAEDGGPLAAYFEDAARDANQIRAMMRRFNIPADVKVLEFASGFGRVTRHLRDLNISASDIHPQAVAFLREKMRVNAILSSADPAAFTPPEKYQLIFVLSLFSQLSQYLFDKWLEKLYSLVSPGGILMFTTHGSRAAEKTEPLRNALNKESGFGYISISDQPDLDPSFYGSSVATLRYVSGRILEITGVEPISFASAAWWERQDEWVIRKPAAA